MGTSAEGGRRHKKKTSHESNICWPNVSKWKEPDSYCDTVSDGCVHQYLRQSGEKNSMGVRNSFIVKSERFFGKEGQTSREKVKNGLRSGNEKHSA